MQPVSTVRWQHHPPTKLHDLQINAMSENWILWTTTNN